MFAQSDGGAHAHYYPDVATCYTAQFEFSRESALVIHMGMHHLAKNICQN